MVKPWMFLLVAAAFWGVYTLFTMGGWDEDEMMEVCHSTATSYGIPSNMHKRTCRCAWENAEGWIEANPDEEYTEEVHRRMMTPCANSYHASRRPIAPHARFGAEKRFHDEWVAEANGRAPQSNDWGQ